MAHLAEIDEDRAIDEGVSGHAVTAASDRKRETVLADKFDRFHHVMFVDRLDNSQGPVILSDIDCAARGVVSGIVNSGEGSGEPGAEAA